MAALGKFSRGGRGGALPTTTPVLAFGHTYTWPLATPTPGLWPHLHLAFGHTYTWPLVTPTPGLWSHLHLAFGHTNITSTSSVLVVALPLPPPPLMAHYFRTSSLL